MACFSDLPSAGAGMGCWIVGVQWGGGVCFVGVCFGFGKKHFGATYHLHDEYHILNILWGDGA